MYSWILGKLIAAWILPPGVLVLMGLAGLVLLKKKPRIGKILLGGSVVLLWALSAPLISLPLIRLIETPPLDVKATPPAQAIVVLGGGRYRNAPEYGADTVNQNSLERVRYAAWLHRHTGVPILTSGGVPGSRGLSEAQAMKAVLENEYKVPVQWVEQVSRDTFEQASATRAVLVPSNVRRIYLVTHAWHMPRSVDAYTRAGFDVVAAPTGFKGRRVSTIRDLVPSADTLLDSYYFFHEAVGLLWYQIRYAFREDGKS